MRAAIALKLEKANQFESATNTTVSNLGDLYAVADKSRERADTLEAIYKKVEALDED